MYCLGHAIHCRGTGLDDGAQRLEDDLVEVQREMQYQREELQDALAARERGADELAAVLEQRGKS